MEKDLAHFDEWLSQWNKFVSEVENGYKLTIYDYTNDLCLRNILEEIMSSTPSEIKRKLAESTQGLDERFDKATQKISDSLLPNYDSWWWYRIPRKLESELEKDLKDEGFIK